MQRSSALNGLDSRPRKKHSGTTGEDVLLNQGIGLGKSAGRPFLPCFLPSIKLSAADKRALFFSSIGQKKSRRLPHTKSLSSSSRLSGRGFLFMCYMTITVHGCDPGEPGRALTYLCNYLGKKLIYLCI